MDPQRVGSIAFTHKNEACIGNGKFTCSNSS
jgi:hypothetical protein